MEMNTQSEQTTTALMEVQQGLGRPPLGVPELLAGRQMPLPLLLGDASSSAPNFRASEFVIAAMFAAQGVPVLTNIYPNTHIEHALRNIPTQLTALSLAPENMPLFVKLYDPQARIQKKVGRMVAEGADPQAIQDWINAYLESLPAGMFNTADGTNYIQAVLTARRELFTTFAQMLGADPGLIAVEEYSARLRHLTVRQVLAATGQEPDCIGKLVCPECSLARDTNDDMVKHVIGADGSLHKNYGSYMNVAGKLPSCAFFKNLVTTFGNPLDMPLSDLLGLGVQVSGKLAYMLEALVYQNPGVNLGIREYWNPRGTIAQVAQQWEGLTILTPRINISVKLNATGSEWRDATGFELVQYLTQHGTGGFLNFVSSVPLVGDNQQYVFSLSEET
jgi:hypothetical protein